MTSGPKFPYQRRYPYTCSGCGKLRFTRKYDRRVDELCTKCERGIPDENQVPLFPLETPTAEEVAKQI